MKRVLIVETAKVTESSTIAHVRNAIILWKCLSKYLHCELVDLNTELDYTKQWDVVLFSYASMGANFENIDKLLNNQKSVRVGWITNEFELFANDYVKKNMSFMINNFDEKAIKKAHTYSDLLTVNLNTLLAKERNQETEKKYTACYYGTYRKYREVYFKKYLKGDVVLSASKKNWKKFIDLDLDCKVTDKINWTPERETLNLFKGSLYIEDTKTHENFNYLANRFFEGLFCNTPLFFDTSCKNTINKDIYTIDDYFYIDSSEELVYKVNNIDTCKRESFLQQNTEIALNEKEKTIKKIAQFLNDIG